LSFAQQRLWFLDQVGPGNPAYNIPACCRLTGQVNLMALEQALNEIIRRHETLRTSFLSAGGKPIQVINQTQPLALTVVDLDDFSLDDREARFLRLADQEASKPFNIERGELLRAVIIRLSRDEFALLLTLHHIVSDGWSIGILVRELGAIYESFSGGRATLLPALPIQYVDFAQWQRDRLQGAELDSLLTYWKGQLSGSSTLELPTDHARPPVQTYGGSRILLDLSPELNEAIRRFSREEGVTLFMTLLAAFQTFLHRYTRQDDIVVGTPISNRNHVQVEGLIGFFTNLLVLRTDLSGDPPFRRLVRRVKEVTLSAYAHQELPFEKLIEALQTNRDPSRHPLFQILLAVENAHAETLQLPNLALNSFEVENHSAKFDLALSIWETEKRWKGAWEYNTSLFEAPTVARMNLHFQALLENLLANPECPVSQLNLLTEAERNQLLIEWNDTRTARVGASTINQLVEDQAELKPDALALTCGQEHLTYGELNGRANQFGRWLRRQGVGPEARVGVCVGRSLEMVVGMLAALKAGGAYVPLDRKYPWERLRYMVEASEVKLVLTDGEQAPEWREAGAVGVEIGEALRQSAGESGEEPASGVEAGNLAYVIYTSGSTGRPKGVGIRHGSMTALVEWAGRAYRPEELRTVVAGTSICFDLSVFEIFAPLAWGGRVVVVEDGLEMGKVEDAGRLVNTVPSVMTQALRMKALGERVGVVNLAGEKLGRGLVEELYAAGVGRVVNLYGPTEDTTYSTWMAIERGEEGEVAIGRPIAGTQVYVVDEGMGLAPVGVRGELYIGGAGLARGYVWRPDLTAEKFVPNPFSAVGGERVYRTGDDVRWRSDGALEYLGRRDEQVKLRGYRIELGEIEHVLEESSWVKQAVVVAQQDGGGDKRLIAYLVANSPAPSVTELRHFIKDRLPEYMTPSQFILLESMPLTRNGKVDRDALPKQESLRPALGVKYAPPSAGLERSIAEIWRQVLGIDKVGRDDNFFDLGGHSMHLLQVHHGLKEALGAGLPIVELFKYPTIGSLAAYWGQEGGRETFSHEARDRAERRSEAIHRRQRLVTERN
jgi:amino acid adenylation domain-containing protein